MNFRYRPVKISTPNLSEAVNATIAPQASSGVDARWLQRSWVLAAGARAGCAGDQPPVCNQSWTSLVKFNRRAGGALVLGIDVAKVMRQAE